MNKIHILSAVVGLFVSILTTQSVSANVAKINATSPISGVSVEVGVPQIIKWTSSDYPAGAEVNINLLRQVSANPNKFEFVKTIKKDAQNDGEEIWLPSSSDIGNNLVIQVSCSQSFVFPEGCLSENSINNLTVIDKTDSQSYAASAISGLGGIMKKVSNFFGSLIGK